MAIFYQKKKKKKNQKNCPATGGEASSLPFVIRLSCTSLLSTLQKITKVF